MNFWAPLEIIRLSGVAIAMGFNCLWGFLQGFIVLTQIPTPTVTIFGGKHVRQDSELAKQVYQLARLLVKHDISIITGGGPGVMLAANCGAASVENKKKKAMTFGIGMSGVDTKFVNMCATLVVVPYFFIRQWLLIRYSQAFIIFPGGIGTVNELFETLNLMKLHKVPKLPVILVDKNYWQPLVDWYYKKGLMQEFIPEHAKDLFVFVDDINHAFEIVKKAVR